MLTQGIQYRVGIQDAEKGQFGRRKAGACMSSVRVLVVEDYEPFRRFICSTLKQRPDLEIIGEASDGLDAVQKAEELRPDLVLLDIGLPTLNGLEAARRIRKLSPEAKILFLTQESAADLVQEALKLGALGYVVKARAASELLAAVETVRRGMQFVSEGLFGHSFTDAADTQVPDRLSHEKALPPLRPRKAEISSCHALQVYSDDALFLDGFTRFITAALKADDAVVVVATELHRGSLLQRLQAGGVDVAAAIERKRYIPLDIPDMPSTRMVNGVADPAQCAKGVGDLVLEAVKAARGEHLRIAAG